MMRITIEIRITQEEEYRFCDSEIQINKFLNSIDIEGVWIDGIITFVYHTFQHEY